jgi:hypothetical protein
LFHIGPASFIPPLNNISRLMVHDRDLPGHPPPYGLPLSIGLFFLNRINSELAKTGFHIKKIFQPMGGGGPPGGGPFGLKWRRTALLFRTDARRRPGMATAARPSGTLLRIERKR